jgi:hypothetical protein
LLFPGLKLHQGNHNFVDIFKTCNSTTFSLACQMCIFLVVMYFTGSEPWRNMLKCTFGNMAIFIIITTPSLTSLFYTTRFWASHKQNPQKQIHSRWSVFCWFLFDFLIEKSQEAKERHTETLCSKQNPNSWKHDGFCS